MLMKSVAVFMQSTWLVLAGFCFPLAAQELSALKFVDSLENPLGGYWPNLGAKGKSSSLRSTVAALRVYKYEGKALPNFEKHRDFMLSCWHEKDSGFADFPGGPTDVILAAVGLMGARDGAFLNDEKRTLGTKYLVEKAKIFEEIRMASAFLADEPYDKKVAESWQKTILTRANKDGTFGSGFSKPRDSASAWVTLLRLQFPLKNDELFSKHFRMKDGGFGSESSDRSDLETAYRVSRYFHMIKNQKMLRETLGFIETCRNEDGGYGPRPGEKSALGSTYHAIIIKKWADPRFQK
jgi:hypothetical protein